jgi:hypothetical protein
MSLVQAFVCPILENCLAVTKIDCAGRNAKDCSFFRNLLSEYCKSSGHGKCGLCKYAAFCDERRF